MHGCVFCIMSFCFYFSIMLVKLIRWDFLVFFLLLTKILFSSWLKKNYSISFKKKPNKLFVVSMSCLFFERFVCSRVEGLQFCCILFSSFYVIYIFNFLTFFSFRVYWRNSSRVQEELAVPLQWWTANIPCRRQSGLV